ELHKIIDFDANVIEVTSRVHFGTCRLSRPSEIEQCADFIQCESQLACAPDEGEDARLDRSIDATAARGTWWCLQHFDFFVIARLGAGGDRAPRLDALRRPGARPPGKARHRAHRSARALRTRAARHHPRLAARALSNVAGEHPLWRHAA